MFFFKAFKFNFCFYFRLSPVEDNGRCANLSLRAFSHKHHLLFGFFLLNLFAFLYFPFKGLTICNIYFSDETFKQDFLEAHNAYRALHGVPPLTYNKELCDKAQEWAESCLQNKCLSHSKTDDGENVYSKSGFPQVTTTGNIIQLFLTSKHIFESNEVFLYSGFCWYVSGKEAVEAWYSEIKDYNFAKPGFQSGTGITQRRFPHL